MYSTKLSRKEMKKDTSPRVVTSHGKDGIYTAERVHMSTMKTGTGARNKIGSGSDNQNYSATRPPAAMGKEVGNANRVVSHHDK